MVENDVVSRDVFLECDLKVIASRASTESASNMRFVNPISFVNDIERSRTFYRDVLGLRVLKDFGSFVLFETGFAIHDGNSLERTVWGAEAAGPKSYGYRNVLFYFEDDDVDAAFEKVAPHVELIHPVEKQEWGQRVFRFYDPDGHAVEIGEPQHIETAED